MQTESSAPLVGHFNLLKGAGWKPAAPVAQVSLIVSTTHFNSDKGPLHLAKHASARALQSANSPDKRTCGSGVSSQEGG